ncbi:bifunctional [glutamate--ammonia ligase]-adenylyl-L-tyrosine phosphorylase/[glutamate--ammonia-ligase] adenylyltransferase [Luteimonas deserti]|uniref:Bifunctional glutamine synthetase adenylyltransferase/adenylyl-removing enzyme n=1 Tax=Luteimonas deserti TaxID=2752306 RepID=A0A7Z0QP10_9GAMM|nr:bifunctional [glutamate--ammonia ligase]-adenylyl-L-tyrosine phosphorylase/[glutamate--ammonia-ligase] adenylyltransferase [Luteimonas deserti]NYZ62127.1 bifunctional [glutamate--ammonia ligase]-adenylyl-L-tyrosine phosphorylase/[glutamate--ammonia-ligase] adenylyltransferase [Luteimonas deserti]
MDAPLPADLQAHLGRLVERLPPRFGDADALARIMPVALVSDFALEVFQRQPEVLDALLDTDGACPRPRPDLAPAQRAEWPAQLRRYRRAESARLVWRDVHGLDTVEATLAGSTRLAEVCLQCALDALEAEFAGRHGHVRDADGRPVRLVVFGLGKLGGGELNFSSDIDLVYGFESAGESDGARPLAAEAYFTRLGQHLARLLDETTGDGFCHRVDLRLRPFGNAGRIALSFAAMELYFQREGRDWERYAWQKARPVAGDREAGDRFLALLRPFVYRRYLDFGALDGLRTMKAMITADVARKELSEDIKRGEGGIRDVEFLAQALQLIRGGREPALRERRLLPALEALHRAGQVTDDALAALRAGYLFLRRVENRLQMLRDAQTHVLPNDRLERVRLARGLGFADWEALHAELRLHRGRVGREFEALLAGRAQTHAVGAQTDLAAWWCALPDGGTPDVLAAAGFGDAVEVDAALRDFARSPSVRDLSDTARARLDRLMPVLLQASAPADRPVQAVRRLLAILHTLLRRASYLALLDEAPAALARLVDLVTRSAFLAERLAAHPLLLDELLDSRVEGPLPDRAAMGAACARALRQPDLEAGLFLLNEVRQQLSFRIALARLDRRVEPRQAARALAWLADAVVDTVLTLARRDLEQGHGPVPGARFAVVGYGSLGGEELGFGSDLDLVFLHDAPAGAQSSGSRPLDAQRWAARLAQKVVNLLGTTTGGGRLYQVDVRLRPDGGKGLLVSSLASYAEYQRERAWTWEHQALVRARMVAGDASMVDAFESVRQDTLARAREPERLMDEVAAMRQRMRGELDRSDASRFDLKQGPGGLVDLEFRVQAWVLQGAHAHPALLVPRSTAALIECAEDAGLIEPADGAALREAHARLLGLGLDCMLDRRPRVIGPSPELDVACGTIRRIAGWP